MYDIIRDPRCILAYLYCLHLLTHVTSTYVTQSLRKLQDQINTQMGYMFPLQRT